LLDLLIDDNKVKNEMMKESLELKPIELAKRVQFILRSVYQQRFLGLVIKKFQSAAAEQALNVYLEEKEGTVQRVQTIVNDPNLSRK
jgi:hypothetical protein